ncbi:putative 30S ribosomal protein S6e [groundwater metagenome]|uniref:Putative 30S ribosomal protein S6e n=1 Tax=groundwater metagenome TaxID=717931 RepID=A0A098E771_9ZZZZ
MAVKQIGFKLVMNDGENKKTYQVALDEKKSENFLNFGIGDKVDCSVIGIPGYEVQITGGSDIAGFPMKKGIHQERAAVMVGEGRDRKRRTYAGERTHKNTSQINAKIIKKGDVPIEEILEKISPKKE